jgi:hypothetical protein
MSDQILNKWWCDYCGWCDEDDNHFHCSNCKVYTGGYGHIKGNGIGFTCGYRDRIKLKQDKSEMDRLLS